MTKTSFKATASDKSIYDLLTLPMNDAVRKALKDCEGYEFLILDYKEVNGEIEQDIDYPADYFQNRLDRIIVFVKNGIIDELLHG